MSYYLPAVPAGCRVAGCLYGPEDAELLNSTMLEVGCPAGNPETDVLICAGWHPEEDPSGGYYVVVYRGRDEMILPWTSTDPREVIKLVEGLARLYQPAALPTGVASTAADRADPEPVSAYGRNRIAGVPLTRPRPAATKLVASSSAN